MVEHKKNTRFHTQDSKINSRKKIGGGSIFDEIESLNKAELLSYQNRNIIYSSNNLFLFKEDRSNHHKKRSMEFHIENYIDRNSSHINNYNEKLKNINKFHSENNKNDINHTIEDNISYKNDKKINFKNNITDDISKKDFIITSNFSQSMTNNKNAVNKN